MNAMKNKIFVFIALGLFAGGLIGLAAAKNLPEKKSEVQQGKVPKAQPQKKVVDLISKLNLGKTDQIIIETLLSKDAKSASGKPSKKIKVADKNSIDQILTGLKSVEGPAVLDMPCDYKIGFYDHETKIIELEFNNHPNGFLRHYAAANETAHDDYLTSKELYLLLHALIQTAK
jgi:hypothetical protein